MNGKVAPLSEVVEFLDHLRRPITAAERKPGNVPYYGANGIQGTVDAHIFDEDLVLVAEDGGHFEEPSRGVAYRISGPSWVNNHAHVLRPKDELDVGYLHRALENFNFVPFISGSTRAKLTKGALSSVELRIPSLVQQQRIAAILDGADELRVCLRKARDLLDELYDSYFMELFHSADYPDVLLKEICTKITDGTHRSPKTVEVGVPYLTAKHVKKDRLIFEENPWYISEEDHIEIFSRCDPQPGDVLYIKDGATTGVAAINTYDFEFSLLSSVALIRPNPEKLVPEFLVAFLNNEANKTEFLKEMAGAAIKRFTLSKIKEFKVPLPPIKLQLEFAQFAERFKHHRALVEARIQLVDELFFSLQDRAFKFDL